MISPVLAFLISRLFWLQVLLCFYTHFKIVCSGSMKNVLGILIGIVLHLKIALGSMVILRILIYQFINMVYLFILFHRLLLFSVLQFSKYRSFISLGRSFLGILFFLM